MDELIKFLVMKLHQGPMFFDGMKKLIVVILHSKTNLVKIVQNQFLLKVVE